MEGSCEWNGLRFEVHRSTGHCTEAHGLHCYPATCCLALDYVQAHPLVIRSRQPGDRIAPLGLTGSKKLQDLFVDEKIPEALRATVPVIAYGDVVVWIPGYRIAAEAAVASATAASVQIRVTRYA
jgi:tRNA(Ile)-lysidine synthetase-like protein